MDITDILQTEIHKFVEKEKIPAKNFIFNGSDHYKVSEEDNKRLTEIEKAKLNLKLIQLSDPWERIKLLVAYKYGSFPKMDTELGVSKGTTRNRLKRRLKAFRSDLNLLESDLNIKTK